MPSCLIEDPGEGFSVGPGLPSFTRGSRIAPPSIIPVAHRTSAVEVLYCSTHLDRMEMLVPVLPALPAPLPRAPRSVVFNGLYSTAKYHTIKYTIAIAALAVRPIATMMTTDQLLLVVGGYFLTTDYSQLHVCTCPHGREEAPTVHRRSQSSTRIRGRHSSTGQPSSPAATDAGY